MAVIKIGIVGAECSGKTTLCSALAANYNTLWVKEYACEYLAKLTDASAYTLNDIESINIGQLQNEHLTAQRANKLVLCDTTPLVNKIWAEVKYGFCPASIQQAVIDNVYDYYLLPHYNDVVWEPAPYREHANERKQLFELYKKELQHLTPNYAIILGTLNERLQQSIGIINGVMENKLQCY
jgi:nicotinamide riboside kinase